MVGVQIWCWGEVIKVLQERRITVTLWDHGDM